jgi:cullin-associated NEDD8-dissociated protein 1
LETFWKHSAGVAVSELKNMNDTSTVVPSLPLQFVLGAMCEMLQAEASGQHRIVDKKMCIGIEQMLISPLLVVGAADADEATARILGECLGALLRLEPAFMLPQVSKILKSSSTKQFEAQQQILFAIQIFVADATAEQARTFLPQACEALLFALEQDAQIPNIAHGALQTLNALVHHHPSFVDESRCTRVWTAILSQMPVRADLKRVVDLGPFKQKIDDGLPVRKAAYTCATTLLQQIPSRIIRRCGNHPTNGFMKALVGAICSGLKETEYDARILCQQILLKLFVIETGEIVKRGKDLLAPFALKLGKTKLTVDASATSNQQERNLVTSSVRVLFTLQNMPRHIPHPLVDMKEFHDLIQLIHRKPALRAIWDDASR